VDSEDGWSLVQTTSGAPAYKSPEKIAKYLDKAYVLSDTYLSMTQYAVGEFYWPVMQGQLTYHQDFLDAGRVLNREVTPAEEVWSLGEKIPAEQVQSAFDLRNTPERAFKRDADVTSESSGFTSILVAVFWVVLVLWGLFLWLNDLVGCDPAVQNCSSSYSSGDSRTSGGSYGGYSSGGSHK
jgi:hypothetical protein